MAKRATVRRKARAKRKLVLSPSLISNAPIHCETKIALDASSRTRPTIATVVAEGMMPARRQDAMSKREMINALGLSKRNVEQRLYELREQNRLRVAWERRPDITGRINAIPVYWIVAENE